MAEEVSQILAMLSEGKITAEEAEKLIGALHPEPQASGFPFDEIAKMGRGRGRGRGPRWGRGRHRHGHGLGRRFLRIVVDEEGEENRERINIKVPLKLLRAGISLGGLMPREAKEKISEALRAKGIEVDPFSLTGADADEIAEALSDLEIDIDGEGKKLRIHVLREDDADDDGDVDSDADRRD